MGLEVQYPLYPAHSNDVNLPLTHPLYYNYKEHLKDTHFSGSVHESIHSFVVAIDMLKSTVKVSLFQSSSLSQRLQCNNYSHSIDKQKAKCGSTGN